jgi:hypothetical protein
MEPITGILAAVSAANAAFGAVKKLVATGREIQDVAGQIGKWYGAFGDFNRLATEKANKKPSVFKRLLHDDSIEQEALQITMHKQALIKQEYELKILIVAHYGESVYNEMIMERIRLKKEREKKEREHRADMDEIMEKARAAEAKRDAAKAKSPYYSYSSMALQLAIVLSSAAILAVTLSLFYASIGVGAAGVVLFLVALGV